MGAIHHVLMSIFAGALSDRWDKRRTMIVCDLLAVFSTGLIGLLLAAGQLQIWHLYLLNAFSGLMGTVQQPASEVAVTLLTPRDFYQKIYPKLKKSLKTLYLSEIPKAERAYFTTNLLLTNEP